LNKEIGYYRGNLMNAFTVFYIVLFLGPGILFGQAGRKKVMEGNRLFSEEKYDEANNKYQDAMLEDPGSPVIQFNVGDVLYKKNSYEKAMEAYQKAMDSDDPLFQSKSYYNIGNTLYRNGKLPESILAYEQALKLNPDDQDAKYNLEFVRNKLKENADKQQQQPQQDQQPEQQPQNKNKDEDGQKEKQQKEQEESTPPSEEQEQKKEMSKEEAQRLLDALKENQEDLKKKQVKGKGRASVGKDW
jgi:Ca-activated chloride channel family protein